MGTYYKHFPKNNGERIKTLIGLTKENRRGIGLEVSSSLLLTCSNSYINNKSGF